MDSRVVFVLAVVVAGLCVYAEAAGPSTAAPPKKPLQCYACQDCGDPFNVTKSQNTLKTCTSNEFFCFKLTRADKKIDRGCAMKKNECSTTGKECLTCEKSQCNSGHRLNVAFALPAMTIAVASLANFLSGAVWKRG